MSNAFDPTIPALFAAHGQRLYQEALEGIALRDAEIAELRKQVKIAQHERDVEIYKQERTIHILTGLHALLYPPRFSDNDGRTWQFKSPLVEEQMQELSDRIRAIPDDIEAIAATEPKP